MKIEWGDSLFLIYTGIKCVYNVYLLDRMSSKKPRGSVLPQIQRESDGDGDMRRRKNQGGEAAPVDPIDLVSTISGFEEVLDEIQRRSGEKESNQEDIMIEASRLNDGIKGLKQRMYLEKISDRDGSLTRRIKKLEDILLRQYGLKFENLDPQTEHTKFAASYILSFWDTLKSSEYYDLSEPEQGRLQKILQEVLPVEAIRYLQSLNPGLPMDLLEDKVNKELSVKMRYLLDNAKNDMTAYFGINSMTGALDCLDWEEYSQLPETDEKLRLLKLAIQTSIKTSLQKTTFAENLSSIVQTALYKPVKALTAVGSAAVFGATATSFVPVLTVAGSAVGDAAAALVSNPQFVEVIKTMTSNPKSTFAFVTYVITNAPTLLDGLYLHFGINRDGPEGQRLRSLVDRMNEDYMAYRERDFVGPIPASILTFHDALLSMYSLVYRTIYRQSGELGNAFRTIFRAPGAALEFCKSVKEKIGDGFQNFVQFLRDPDQPLSDERHAWFHDNFRAALFLHEDLSETEEARARLVSLSVSDRREYEIFQARLDRLMAADAAENPELYNQMSDTLEAQTDSLPFTADDMEKFERTVPAHHDPAQTIFDPHGTPLESNPEPKTFGEADMLHAFRGAVLRGDMGSSMPAAAPKKGKGGEGNGGVAKRKGGGKRTARRKATTKKQKSKKNKRQSRRKVRRSSSRRSRK
jgi:hypothetical protein